MWRARQVMACSIEREARGRPAEVSCMDVVEGKAPKAQEIGQGAGAGLCRVREVAGCDMKVDRAPRLQEVGQGAGAGICRVGRACGPSLSCMTWWRARQSGCRRLGRLRAFVSKGLYGV